MTDDIRRQLGARSVADRLTGVDMVKKLEDDQAIPMYVDVLNDRSHLVIAKAAENLRGYASEEAIGPLIQTYRRLVSGGEQPDPGCVAKWEIVTTLSHIVAEAGIDPSGRFREPHASDIQSTRDVLIHAIKTVQIERSGNGLDDMAVGLRGQAALGMASTKCDDALFFISLVLFDTQPPADLLKPPEEAPFVTALARRSAARALSVLGDPGGAAPLGVKLAYPEGEVPEVLVECMDAICVLNGEAALTLLPAYLKFGDEGSSASSLYLTAGAATALASLSQSYHKSVLDHLVPVCRESMLPDVQQSIALAVASIRGDAAYEGLEMLTYDDNAHVRLATIPALEMRGGERARSLLKTLKEDDDDPRVVSAAGKALVSVE